MSSFQNFLIFHSAPVADKFTVPAAGKISELFALWWNTSLLLVASLFFGALGTVYLFVAVKLYF